MDLIELKKYKTEVVLFIHKFNEPNPNGMFGGIGQIAPIHSPLIYDQNFENWHIFHLAGESRILCKSSR